MTRDVRQAAISMQITDADGFAARWPAPPDNVFALFTDVAFLRDRGIALGAEVQEVTVADTETAVRLAIPIAVIPPVFARFVGSAVSFVERTTWTPDGDGAHRAALDARAAVLGRAVASPGNAGFPRTRPAPGPPSPPTCR